VEDEFDGTMKDFIFRGILRSLNGHHGAGSHRLLDIGAHAGRFMFLAQQRGWTVEGIELNPRTAACAARRTGAPVHQVNVHALGADNRGYEAVTMIDVLEHVPEPLSVLAAIAAIVEPGGRIGIKVPHGAAQDRKERVLAAVSSHTPTLATNLVHVNHFSVRSLTLALERAGFTQATVRTGAPELTPLTAADGRGAIANAVRLAVYAAARLPGAVHTPLALNLQAFAVKPGASPR
jgi:SAM-dependent methyltransferase